MRYIFTLLLLVLPRLAFAHPHIFITTALTVEVDENGQATAVGITWTYDPLYSLLILEDKELDDDYDGKLRPDEIAQLSGFDMQWIDGYEGDLYASLGGVSVPLGPPQSLGAVFEDGMIITKHRRSLSAPATGLVLQAYDPTYYSAYDLNGGVSILGPCLAFVDPADIETATDIVAALLVDRPQTDENTYFPEVGIHFADTVTLSCD
ncbi:MAG: DUF1007 family protein [Aliishimia sp.]